MGKQLAPVFPSHMPTPSLTYPSPPTPAHQHGVHIAESTTRK